ncbi:hypothetical protein AKJ38_02635, partial [candidate division MSBL1 archaeon SCGC-AAA259I14]
LFTKKISLKGDLKKVISSGSTTSEWLKRTFVGKKFSDTVYVSSNPYINSRGVEVIEGIDLTNTFFKIIDVWDIEWNRKYKTVVPSKVSKNSQLIKRMYPEKKLIIHFMQPHEPYLTIKPHTNSIDREVKRREKSRNKIVNKIRKLLREVGTVVLGHKNVRKIGTALGLIPLNEIETIAKKYGTKTVKKAYKENLRIVLKEVVTLSNKLEGNNVITSDHGEFLGEDNYFGHPRNCSDPISRIVPWLELK